MVGVVVFQKADLPEFLLDVAVDVGWGVEAKGRFYGSCAETEVGIEEVGEEWQNEEGEG